jgi:hypothetical protein
MGFTHCAANYDFTSTATFNNGMGWTGYNFSDPTTWLDCSDSGDAGPLLYRGDASSAGGIEAPCSDVNIIKDNNINTLDISFTPTDFTNGVSFTDLASISRFNDPSPAGAHFPNGSYVDMVYRVPQSTYDSVSPDTNQSGGGTILGGIWFYGWGDNGGKFLEHDSNELYAANPSNYTSTNEYEWGPCDNGVCTGQSFHYGGASGYDPTTYHDYGYLMTEDGSSTIGQCGYLDGSALTYSGFNGCSSNTVDYAASMVSPSYLIFWSGAGSDYKANTCGSITCQTPNGNVDLYVRRVTIFTCSSWSPTNMSATCDTTIPTSPP